MAGAQNYFLRVGQPMSKRSWQDGGEMNEKSETENRKGCFARAEPSSMGTPRTGGEKRCRRYRSATAVQNRAGRAAIAEKMKITKRTHFKNAGIA